MVLSSGVRVPSWFCLVFGSLVYGFIQYTYVRGILRVGRGARRQQHLRGPVVSRVGRKQQRGVALVRARVHVRAALEQRSRRVLGARGLHRGMQRGHADVVRQEEALLHARAAAVSGAGAARARGGGATPRTSSRA